MCFSRQFEVCCCTDHCPAPRRCCISSQRCTSGGWGWRRCSRSCLDFCVVRWAPGSGAGQHSRQSCTVCLKTWLGKTHKAVVTLILFTRMESYDHMNMIENMCNSWIPWFTCPVSICLCIQEPLNHICGAFCTTTMYVCNRLHFLFIKKKKEEDGKVLTLCNIMHFYYTYFKVSFIKTYLQTWRETKLEQYRFVSRVYYCIYTVSTMKPA